MRRHIIVGMSCMRHGEVLHEESLVWSQDPPPSTYLPWIFIVRERWIVRAANLRHQMGLLSSAGSLRDHAAGARLYAGGRNRLLRITNHPPCLTVPFGSLRASS